MTDKEKMLVVKLLDMASDEFSNHGCNDFDLREQSDLTTEEMVNFDKAWHEWNGDPEEHEPERAHFQTDWALMRYFADRLRKETGVS